MAAAKSALAQSVPFGSFSLNPIFDSAKDAGDAHISAARICKSRLCLNCLAGGTAARHDTKSCTEACNFVCRRCTQANGKVEKHFASKCPKKDE